jgi:hypothetical protein
MKTVHSNHWEEITQSQCTILQKTYYLNNPAVETSYNFTFMVPCIIIHKLNKTQQDALLFLKSSTAGEHNRYKSQGNQRLHVQ